ncbi:MAG: HI0074 family nucleotidyltransferase substrate-binding subunit [Holosporales bacterium]
MIDISPLEKAIAQLQESLNYADSDLAKYDARLARQFRSAAIQGFEYTYELSHKMLKRYLEATEPTPESIDAMSFQELIRTGAEKGLLLHSWDVWHFYRQCRSITSHTYDEEKADDVFSRLKDFLEEAAFLCAQIKKRQTLC